MYSTYLNNYRENGLRPKPWKLLFVLLLNEKSELIYEKSNTKLAFYNNNKQIIDNNIKKILVDFDIKKEELIREFNVVIDEDNYDKIIWNLFSETIDAITFVLGAGKSLTIDEIYEGYNITGEVAVKSKKFSIFKKVRN